MTTDLSTKMDLLNRLQWKSPSEKPSEVKSDVTINRSDEIIAMAALSSIGNVITERSENPKNVQVYPINTCPADENINQSNSKIENNAMSQVALKIESTGISPNIIYVYDGSKRSQNHGRVDKKTSQMGFNPPINVVSKERENSDPPVITPIANQMVVSSAVKEIFKCEECKYSTHNRNYLKQHVDLIHNASRQYKCPFCDYAGKRSHSLREHLIVHSNERPYMCSYCNATFRKKGHLTNHEKLHRKSVRCPVCQEWLQSSEVEKHMKEKHNSKNVLACDLCEFIALDGQILNKHIESHEKAAQQKQPIVCSSCKKMSPDFESFLIHAKSHEKDIQSESQQEVTKTPPTNVMIKCSECGVMTSDQESMKAHMWEHISPNLKRDKNIRDTGIKNVKEAAYKCLDCDFTCEEAKTFVVHMVKHKPDLKGAVHEEVTPIDTSDSQPQREKPAISTQSDKDSNIVIMPPLGTGSSPATKQQIEKYLADKFSKPTTDKESVINIHPVIQQVLQNQSPVVSPNKKQEQLPFVQDHANAKFRCTICGYTCDYQRTIKAHIWKHSGNKDIEYPMFRNGPLSVYEDLTVASVMKEYVLPKDKVPAGQVDALGMGKLKQTKNIKMAVSPVAPALASLLAMRAKQKPDEPEMDKASTDAQTPKRQQKEQTNVNLNITKVPGTDSLEINISTKSVSDPDQSRILTEQTEQKQDIPLRTKDNLQSVQKRKAYESDENTDLQQAVKRVCQIDNNSKSVVVERIDTLSSVSMYTSMNSGENSPKSNIQVESNEDQDSGVTMESNISSHVKMNAAKAKVDTEADNMTDISYCTDDLQTVELVVSSGQTNEEDSSDSCSESEPLQIYEENENKDEANKRCRTTSVTTESAVTLLSLLQKGPNVNPACPVQNSDREDTLLSKDIKNKSEADSSKKGGISSSLLAVIEQLRERSHERDILEEDAAIPVKRGTKRKIKRDSEDDIIVLESMDNVEKTDELKFRCKLCHYSNSDSFMIRQHMRLHKEKKPFECSLCEFLANSSEDLQDHMIKHCKVRTYQCKLCSSAFNYKSQLRAHMRAHNDKDVFVCDDCDYESNNPVAFRNHVRGHAEKKLYKCEVCENRFVSKHDLKTHKKLVCGKNRSFSCDECDFVAIGPQEQKLHAKIHNKEFKCAKCDYVTTSITRFQTHTKTHEEEPKSLKCELCDFPAVSSRSLKSHMKRHINDQRFVQQPLEQYKCNLCGYVCHHLPSLKSHMWRHASDTNYSYEFTNEVINAAIDYDCHFGSRDCHEVDIVSFFNTIRQKLKERLSKENTDKESEKANYAVCWVTFRCCQCGFETINKAELNVHMKSHSDVIQWTLQVPKDEKKKEKA